MEITGTIHSIGQTQTVSDKFQKREFVIATDEQYPQHIGLEFTQDKCSKLDEVKVGQKVTVGINLKGRLWTDPKGVEKCFNTLQAWKITADANSLPVHNAEIINTQTEEEDDLGF